MQNQVIIFITALAIFAAGSFVSLADGVVTFEAESGVLGSAWATSNSTSPAYITILTDGAGNNPPGQCHAEWQPYAVTFPSAGAYDLYARVRVGPNTFNDDSMYYANGFGGKTATVNTDWILVNGLAPVGYTGPADVVANAGTTQSGVWKWINLSRFAPGPAFTVSAGNLTQTFQIGARENGLDLDKFAFGISGTSFTVADLDNGSSSAPPTNAFVGPDGIAFHRFSPLNNGINADGANPTAGLASSGGVLCGTTVNGGLQGAGTVFYMSTDGSNFVASHSFASTPDAGSPLGELSVTGNGFFGTSFGGGNNGVGAVFIGETNGSLSVIRSFSTVSADNATNYGGASLSAFLALSGNVLYGTTTAGGVAANGTVFSVTTNGALISVLHDFSLLDSQAGKNTDVAVRWGGLILSGETLYCTAFGGGGGGNGVIFSILTNGASFTALHSFTPLDTLTGTNADGGIPYGGLVLSNGILYGTTFAGGLGGRGTIFSLQTDGLGFAVLHHFNATGPGCRHKYRWHVSLCRADSFRQSTLWNGFIRW